MSLGYSATIIDNEDYMEKNEIYWEGFSDGKIEGHLEGRVEERKKAIEDCSLALLAESLKARNLGDKVLAAALAVAATQIDVSIDKEI